MSTIDGFTLFVTDAGAAPLEPTALPLPFPSPNGLLEPDPVPEPFPNGLLELEPEPEPLPNGLFELDEPLPFPKGDVALVVLSLECIAALTAAPAPADARTSAITATAARTRRATFGGFDARGGGDQPAFG